jgi:hypothetical protein
MSAHAQEQLRRIYPRGAANSLSRSGQKYSSSLLSTSAVSEGWLPAKKNLGVHL